MGGCILIHGWFKHCTTNEHLTQPDEVFQEHHAGMMVYMYLVACNEFGANDDSSIVAGGDGCSCDVFMQGSS